MIPNRNMSKAEILRWLEACHGDEEKLASWLFGLGIASVAQARKMIEGAKK